MPQMTRDEEFRSFVAWAQTVDRSELSAREVRALRRAVIDARQRRDAAQKPRRRRTSALHAAYGRKRRAFGSRR